MAAITSLKRSFVRDIISSEVGGTATPRANKEYYIEVQAGVADTIDLNAVLSDDIAGVNYLLDSVLGTGGTAIVTASGTTLTANIAGDPVKALVGVYMK